MLEPDTRTLLLDALRPPEGWELGHAIGTTFTLDLQALLIAPLAFAMFDWALDDDGKASPIAILEALRRHADRTTVFHQAGMVSVPNWQPLFVHLESAVVPVSPPRPGAIFHPKVWLLQFTRPDEDPRYRLLVLSRNLTFDTSWDTVVSLDGTRRTKSEWGGPISDFLSDILDSTQRIDDTRRAAITAIAEDVRRVKFDRPENVDDVRFHTFGYRAPSWPFPKDADRAVVISPFAGPSTLARLAVADDATLISRPATLDEVGAAAVAGFSRTQVMASEVLADDVLGEDPSREAPGLDGLHAKVFAFERNGQTLLFTGSPNATEAAFGGGNVEFLVEMRGDAERFPVESLLPGEDGVTSFGDLCTDYVPSESPEADPSRTLTNILESAQRIIGQLDFTATVVPHGDGFTLDLDAPHAPDLPDGVREIRCWRVTAGQGHGATPRMDADGLHVKFGEVSYEGLTSFFAFEVTGTHNGRTDRVRFVVNARLVGAPEDRAESVIAELLANRDDLLRYLLFLLSDSASGLHGLVEAMQQTGAGRGESRGLFEQTALLETLLRALVRDPAKLDHVGQLLSDLEKAGRRDDLVPAEMEAIWRAIAEVRPEVESLEQVRS